LNYQGKGGDDTITRDMLGHHFPGSWHHTYNNSNLTTWYYKYLKGEIELTIKW